MSIVWISVPIKVALLLFSLGLVLRGLLHLLLGTCVIRGNHLEGLEARIVGLVFVLQLPVAVIGWQIIRESEWMGLTLAELSEVAIALIVVGGSYLWAKRYAERNAIRPEPSPSEEAG
jgi:hypothetical protein